MGNRCHFHSFYDTPGLAYLKGSKFTLIISKFCFRYQFLVIAYICTFKLLLNSTVIRKDRYFWCINR